MIQRTLDYISKLLNLTAEEQVIPRKLESINPSLVIPLEYFWEAVGPTQRTDFLIDHSAGSINTVVIPFNDDNDTLLIDWTWVNTGGVANYFVNWDLIDIDKVNQTTIYRDRVNGPTQPAIITRTADHIPLADLIPNQMTQPRLIRNTEELRWFVDQGGAGAIANTLTVRFIEFPKGGPLPRLAF